MTATRIPQSPTPSISPKASNIGARVALGVAVVVGAVGLGYVGNSLSAVIALAVLAGVGIGVSLILKRPELLLPIAIMSLWFEAIAAGPVSLGRVVGLLIPIAVIALVLTTGWRPPALQTRAWAPAMLLLIWSWCGAFYSEQVVNGWFYESFTLFLGVAYGVAFIAFTRSPDQLRSIFRIFVWTGALIAVLSDIAFFGLGYRGYGFTGGANNYAAILVTALPIIVLLARQETGRARFWMWATVPVYLSAIAASGSRMGMILAGVMGAYIFITLPGVNLQRRLLLIVGGGIAMVLGFFVFVLLNPGRFTLGALFSDRGAGRLDIWPAAIAMFKDHPLIGRGLGGFRVNSYEITQRTSGAGLQILRGDIKLGYIEVHNTYLYLLTDLGLIGVVLYLGLIAATLKNLADLLRTPWAPFAWAFIGVIITALVANMFGTSLGSKLLWSIVGFTAACYTKKRVERRVVTVAAA